MAVYIGCAVERKQNHISVSVALSWLECRTDDSRKYLARNECVLSDLRDVVNVWCVEGKPYLYSSSPIVHR